MTSFPLGNPQCVETPIARSLGEARGITRAISVAPMMDWTDRHCRFFHRLISRHALLYTEMITTGALLNGDGDRFLAFDPTEGPLALQLGGDDPVALQQCARRAAEAGYDEINLNVGCPSDRVQKGSFGACLMAEPERVAEGVRAMRQEVGLPITVKHRIGIDDQDRYEDLRNFVDCVAEAGCDRFTVHARKAWLKGLSPRENREIPPLRYEDVYRLKQERPDLVIEINGGVASLEEASAHLERVDAVMIGRAAYHEPFLLASVDRRFFGHDLAPTRRQIVEKMVAYAAAAMENGAALKHVTRHILGLFAGQPGARVWKRTLSERAYRPESRPELLFEAIAAVPDAVLDSPV